MQGIHPDNLDRTVFPSFLLRGFHFFVVLVMGSSDFALFFHPDGLDRTVMPSFLFCGFHIYCGFGCGDFALFFDPDGLDGILMPSFLDRKSVV